MKKILLLSIMLAAILLPANKNEVVAKANADEVVVNKGFITNNLVDENGFVDLTNETTNSIFENNFEAIEKQESYYDDSFMASVMGTESRLLSQSSSSTTNYYYHEDHYNYTAVRAMSNIVYNNSKVKVQRFNTYVDVTYCLDYRLSGSGTDYSQPLELAISLELNKIESFLQNYCNKDFQLPLVTINGYPYMYLNFSATTKEATYTTSNARAYLTREIAEQTETETTYQYGDYVFLEIPFTQVVKTIKVFDNRWFSPNATQTSKIFVKKAQLINSIRTPLSIANIDFNNGKVVTSSTNSIYFAENGDATINAITCNYYKLTSIKFDDGTTLYAKASENHISNRQEEYDLFTDATYTNRFTYDATNSLANKLRNAADDAIFSVKEIAYDTMRKASESSEYATTHDVIDCGTYYTFKKITKDQIHTVTFDTVHAKNLFYTRLAFSAFDDDERVYINKIKALWFKYSFKGQKYSLTINSKDFEKNVAGGDLSNFWLGGILNSANQIAKKDSLGNTFYLTGLKNTDYWCFNWDGSEDLKTTDNKNMFLIYTTNDVYFESLISCIYVDKVGDIVNASSTLPDGSDAPTAIINDDGSVTVIDKNGDTIKGTVDDSGNFVDENGNIREDPKNIDNSKDKNNEGLLKVLKQILAIIPTIAIVAGVCWVISKVGPTIVSIFKKRG